MRDAFEGAPPSIRRGVPIVHRYVLALRLAPPSAPGHLFGWRVVTAQPDVIHLEAVSPILGRAAIVARRPDPTRAVITTYLFFTRPALARALWAVVGPTHRRVAPYLLERAARVPHAVVVG